MALDDVVILNVDTNTLETPFDDLQSLPNDVVGDCLESGVGGTGDDTGTLGLPGQRASVSVPSGGFVSVA